MCSDPGGGPGAERGAAPEAGGAARGAARPEARRGGRARQAWLEAGFAALVAEGGAGLRLERLCDRLGKTRGSFYHHFEDHDAYLRQLATEWAQRQTHALIATQAQLAQPEARAATLDAEARGIDHALDVAMRRFGAETAIVGAILAEVDAARLATLRSVLLALAGGGAGIGTGPETGAGAGPVTGTGTGMGAAGLADAEQAADRLARIEYALFTGWQMLWPEREMPGWEDVATLAALRGARGAD